MHTQSLWKIAGAFGSLEWLTTIFTDGICSGGMSDCTSATISVSGALHPNVPLPKTTNTFSQLYRIAPPIHRQRRAIPRIAGVADRRRIEGRERLPLVRHAHPGRRAAG